MTLLIADLDSGKELLTVDALEVERLARLELLNQVATSISLKDLHNSTSTKCRLKMLLPRSEYNMTTVRSQLIVCALSKDKVVLIHPL